MLWKNIAPHPFCEPSLMAKTWYPIELSEFYVNYGTSYYKITGIVMYSFIHSFILNIYIAPLRLSQPKPNRGALQCISAPEKGKT